MALLRRAAAAIQASATKSRCNALIREGTAKAQDLMERYQQEPSGEMGNRIEAQLKELDHLEAGVQALQA